MDGDGAFSLYASIENDDFQLKLLIICSLLSIILSLWSNNVTLAK